MCLQRFFFLSRLFFFDDESEDDVSGSGSSGKCFFSFSSENFVRHVSGSKPVGCVSGIFSLSRATKSVVHVSVESFEYSDLVESFEYFDLVETIKYFDLVKSFKYFDLVELLEYF